MHSLYNPGSAASSMRAKAMMPHGEHHLPSDLPWNVCLAGQGHELNRTAIFQAHLPQLWEGCFKPEATDVGLSILPIISAPRPSPREHQQEPAAPWCLPFPAVTRGVDPAAHGAGARSPGRTGTAASALLWESAAEASESHPGSPRQPFHRCLLLTVTAERRET